MQTVFPSKAIQSEEHSKSSPLKHFGSEIRDMVCTLRSTIVWIANFFKADGMVPHAIMDMFACFGVADVAHT